MPYGTLNGQINVGNASNNTAQTTTSASAVSTGLGVTIGASYTGRFLVICSGECSNATATDGVQLGLFRNNGGAVPAAGAAVGGATQLSNSNRQFNSISANQRSAFAYTEIDSPGIGTWTYFLAFQTVTGGTAQVTTGGGSDGISMTVIEL